MILMGFDENVKGYRLYDTQSENIITSRDVVIMETEIRKAEIVITGENKELSDSVGDEDEVQTVFEESLESNDDSDNNVENSDAVESDESEFIADVEM